MCARTFQGQTYGRLWTRVSEWSGTKRFGPGHPKNLSGMREAKPVKPILFAEVAGLFEADPAVRITVFKKETPSIVEVVSSIVENGMEPRPSVVQYLGQSGVNKKGAVAHKLTNIMYSIWLMACGGGIDLHHSAVAEHVARRFLQSQMAKVRSPQNPDFDTLGMYMELAGASGGVIGAPRLTAEMAERMKSQASIAKQMRPSREEEQAAAKRQKNDDDGAEGKKEKEKEKASAKAKGKGTEK